jgi:hypothetical protein
VHGITLRIEEITACHDHRATAVGNERASFRNKRSGNIEDCCGFFEEAFLGASRKLMWRTSANEIEISILQEVRLAGVEDSNPHPRLRSAGRPPRGGRR